MTNPFLWVANKKTAAQRPTVSIFYRKLYLGIENFIAILAPARLLEELLVDWTAVPVVLGPQMDQVPKVR